MERLATIVEREIGDETVEPGQSGPGLLAAA